ncbi:MAG: dTMP kinase [Christensenellaceae bacterium]|nr:dTMP kinase [Christensenellaceae bacterium]
MKKGLFITFEGVDGCGKSTQARYLYEYLTKKGEDVLLTREPGGCQISEKIRGIILDVENAAMSDHAEALLYAASRAQLVDEVLLPALSEKKIVICDRFFDSSVAYQGYGRGLGGDYILSLNAHSVENCMPDYTFFMDFSPEDAKKRMSDRGQKDRLESAGDGFFNKVYEGFIALRDRFPERYVSFDVSGTKEQTRGLIAKKAEEILEKWRNS